MIGEDGYMDVRVAGNKIERRRYSIDMSVPMQPHNYSARLLRYVPETRDGERVVWSLGDDVPDIVQGPTDPYEGLGPQDRPMPYDQF